MFPLKAIVIGIAKSIFPGKGEQIFPLEVCALFEKFPLW